MILSVYIFVVLFCLFTSVVFFVIDLRTRLDTRTTSFVGSARYLPGVDERKLS